MREPRLGRPLSAGTLSPPPAPLSVAELPRLVAEVGPKVAERDALWSEGPRLMASALGVHVPVAATRLSCEESTVESPEDVEPPPEKSTGTDTARKKIRPRLEPLTGMEVVEIFTKKKHLGKLQFLHLKAVEGGPYRPYDLRVVPHDQAGAEHYIFSPSSVLHVRDGCSVGHLTLAEWHREALLWTLLQGVPFFRDYRLRKPFSRWHRNVRQTVLQRSRNILHGRLLMVVPQFREALLHLSRLIEELKSVHWLPQDDSRTYTLVDFQSALLRRNKEAQELLKTFLQYRALILNMVQEDSYGAHQDLQQSVEQRQQIHPSHPSQPLHLQLALQRDLRQELDWANHTLQHLGNMAALADHMIVQGMVTVVQREVTSFINSVMTRARPQQGSLFQAELLFGADGQLTLLPPMHLFQETLRGVILSVADSVLQGRRLRGQYHPFSLRQLEWQLGVSAGVQEADREQARITQEALLEVQRLCEGYSWLVDVHLVCSQWSSDSLETMRGWPSQRYHEHIQKVRAWAERVRSVPASVTTSNRLITIHCSHIQEKIGPLLSSVEQDALTLLARELQQRSESLASELKKALDWLWAEPSDLHEFSQYADRVKQYERMSGDLQDQHTYLQSLQETICVNYRHLSAEEVAMEAQVVNLWDHFVPLLRRAGETVSQRLPSMVDTLESTFSSLVQELRGLVSKATSGPYVDPSQKATLTVAQLTSMCGKFRKTAAQLEELSGISANLRGKGLDLSLVDEERQKLEARKGLWELLSVSTTQIQEWSQLSFSKFVVLHAQEKMAEWLQQAVVLERTLLPCDAVLKQTLQLLEGFSQQLPLLAELSSPLLRHKHWRAIFKGMGLSYAPEWNLTVADLISKKLPDHWNMISKVCQEAKSEADVEQAFRKLQLIWEGTLFRLANFILTVWQDESLQPGSAYRRAPSSGHVRKRSARVQRSRDSGTFTVIGLETLQAQTEDSVMTLSSLLSSPHVTELRQEVEHWVQRIQELEKLLGFWQRYQLKWVFLSKVFHESGVMIQKPELFQTFCPVDETYREVVQAMKGDPRVLNFVQLGESEETHGRVHGRSLHVLLSEGLSTMEGISEQLLHLLDSPRREFPRLCFLSDREVTELLSLNPTPSDLLRTVRKCFRGVHRLDIDSDRNKSPDLDETDLSDAQQRVCGVVGGLGEKIPFLCPLEPSSDSLAWLKQLEQRLHSAMLRLMKECAVARQLAQGQKENQNQSLDQTQTQNQDQDEKIEDTPQCPLSPSCSSEVDGVKDVREVEEPPSSWSYISGFPLQCLLVVEEAQWCREVQQAFLDPVPAKRVCLKEHYATKLQTLCQLVQEQSMGCRGQSLESHHTVTVLHAMVLLSIKHMHQFSGLMEVKGDLESSFEWHRMMKYHLSINDQSGHSHLTAVSESNDPSCFVDILGSHLPYGYEYLGPEHWMMVNTPSSDRAILGILLALTCYRCGFVRGPCMSGKGKTVVYLGQALGRQVVTLHCCREMSPSIVLQMLVGALQTGVWLVLDSVNSMTQGALSLLGQHLSEIHHSLSSLLNVIQPQRQGSNKGCTKFDKVQISLAGKTIMAKSGYGCILISSAGYTAEVPENLRVATRPISLVQPDYKVMAEVTLTALGFSEAGSVSHRLLSLFSLAKDSGCLPECVSGGSTSWLVFLNKLIAAARMYLHHTHRGEPAGKDKVVKGDLERQRQLLDMVLRAPEGSEGGAQGVRSDCFKRTNQCAAILQAIAEEQAIIKGVTSVVLSAITNHSKASHFQAIFEEVFQAARCTPYALQGGEEVEEATLKEAMVEELQETGLHPNPCMLSSALSLYHSMKLSRAVVLIGPAGSGKTACHQALAGALRKLASRAVEDGFVQPPCSMDKGTDRDTLSPVLTWSSVDTVVIFPNTLSDEELWGSYHGQPSSWWDGALTKVLRDSEPHDIATSESSTSDCSTNNSSIPDSSQRQKRNRQMSKMKWLVLDGEPLGRPSWLDRLSTLCNPEDPSLCLPTGEKVHLWGRELKILIEAVDLEDASPSVVTRCGLVYHSVKELWSDVWKAELGTLSRDPALDQWPLNLWSRLAEDLFPSTLTFLRQNMLSPVLPQRGARASQSTDEVSYGVQEVMSFIRIFHALLEQFGKSKLKASPKHTDKTEGTPSVCQHPPLDPLIPSALQEQRARNVFVMAYIWGFGGHLHPRHWPQFDGFARKALHESRYRVVLPAEGLVFEHLVHLSEGPLGDTCSGTNNRLQNGGLQVSYTTIPQYETHAYLLRSMLKARQPALVAGESGSGKTTLCQSLLGPKQPHLRLPASSRLRAADLRDLLGSVGCQATGAGAVGTVARQPGLLLFLDDLHHAPCDFGKTSMALETLRQCMSRGSLPTSDGCRFKLLSSGAVSFLATCDTPGEGGSGWAGLSPRLLRLFSVLVLPSLSEELLFSIHAPRLQLWLGRLPSLPQHADMAGCIIAATFDLYRAVRAKFPPRPDRPHFLYSAHDLRKVFQGVCMWRPWRGNSRGIRRDSHAPSGLPACAPATLSSVTSVLNIALLWMHECLHTFGDRLCAEEESQALLTLLSQVAEGNFGSRLCSRPLMDRGEDESRTARSAAATARSLKESERHSTAPVSREGMERGQSGAQSTVLTLGVESEDHTEGGGLGESSHGGSCSDSSVWDSTSDEDPLSDVPSEEHDKDALTQREEEVELHTPELTESLSSPDSVSDTTRTPSALWPSPPKEAKPAEKPERKRSGRLAAQLPQCTSSEPTVQAEERTASTTTPLHVLQNMKATLCDVVFSPDLSEPIRSLGCNPRYQKQDLRVLVQELASTMKRGERAQEADSFTRGYGVHRQGVRQLAHVLRALLIPGGHGALFGAGKGTGRKTTLRLAANLMGYRLLEVHSGNEQTVWEVLKEEAAQAGVQGGNLVVLVHESTSQAVREELVVAMANRTYPGLYSAKEWKTVIQRINALVKNSSKHVKNDRGPERYFQQIQRNVHVFLLLPLTPGCGTQTGESPGAAGSMARVLSLCCCVEVYQPWDTESLVDVATYYLKDYLHQSDLDIRVDRADLEVSISQAMAGIHRSSWRYASVLLPDLHPFGPQSYADFVTHFLYLCAHLCDQSRCQANRDMTVLGRMKELTDKADQYSQEVLSLRTKLTEMQQHLLRLQQEVDVRRTLCDRARQHCLQEENRLAQLEEEVQQAQKESRPLYQAALEAVQSLSQSDLDEVRRYRRPPEGIMVVMDTICMLFNRPCNWESAKQLLGLPNFLQELGFYDRSLVRGALFDALTTAVRRPELQPEAVREASRACESLCRWVQAVHRYASVWHRLAPREAWRCQLEERAAESRARLREARLQEEEARDWLEGTVTELRRVRRSVEELEGQLRQAEARERGAAAAVHQVAQHVADWNTAAQETVTSTRAIPGDTLILAAALTYLGPFGPDVRSELLAKWRKLCLTGQIDMDPTDPRAEFLSAPPSVPPPTSPFLPIPMSEELGIPLARVVGRVQDTPQGVAPQLLLKLLLWGLRQGVERGLKVLVTHVERVRLSPEFLELLTRQAGTSIQGLAERRPAGHPDFRLFLSTPLPVRKLLEEIHPLILAEVQVIDLSWSAAEMQELMLAEMVQAKCPKLWGQRCLLKTNRQKLLDRLQQEEVSLMEYVLQSCTPVLEDPHFLPRVSACQEAVSSLQAELLELDQELDRHSPLLAGFHKVAELASAFYQALQDVARLCPLYLFPLHRYLQVVREALALQGLPDVGCSGEEVAGTVMEEALVSHLMARYQPCLFQSHAPVLQLLVSVALCQRDEVCGEAERVAFLRGLGDEGFPRAPRSDPHAPLPELPSWVPVHARSEVLRLQSLPPFGGLVASLGSCPEQWREYLRFPSSTVVGPVPCPSHSHLSMLQRALLWRTLLPHWLAAVADDLAACQLGCLRWTPVAAGSGNPEELTGILAKTEGPVILLLPGPKQPGPLSVHPLHWLKQAAQSTKDTAAVKVKVISFGAECQKEEVLAALDLAVQEGHWLVFNNCHLLDQWDEEVLCQVTQLMSCTARGQLTDAETEEGLIAAGVCEGRQVHPCFRLWFVTRAPSPLSVPAAVRASALRLVCDSPWDLREALCGSLRQVLSHAVPGGGPCTPETTGLLCCAVLHSVLLQRGAYRHLGQGNLYSWTQEDLQALVEAHVRIGSLCDDPAGALEYIAASLVYGGHVEDSADLETVRGVATACLRPPPPTWGRGPHTLSALIIHGHFGSGDLLPKLEYRVWTLSHSGDPLLLGLGAGMEGELVRMRSRNLDLLLRQSQSPAAGVGVGESVEGQGDLARIHDRLQALWDSLGQKEGRSLVGEGTMSQTPLCHFLQQEWDGLVQTLSFLLENLTRPIRSSRPTLSTSPLPTLSALSRLERRAELLQAYLRRDGPDAPPYAYQLSAFHNPRGFLSALLRETALTEQGDVSDARLHFQVQPLSQSPSAISSAFSRRCLHTSRMITCDSQGLVKSVPSSSQVLSVAALPDSLPPHGAYLCGLELQGALWDTRLGALQDTLSPRPCPFPLIWVTAQVKAPEGPACSSTSLPLYYCPLYLEAESGEGDWGLGEGHIVTRVPLTAKLDPVLCSLRRVRLVSSLQDRPQCSVLQ
ncbi:dynein heavy chain domain-containing protein 1 [Megalops cyprinoides]|uniref:dynein heavy chain domain-containing protein 1 n=1 Tax=Megalops cyprinoides TaxID=118141 RepID=UPI00186408CF|nr:dynein heavy chain domain-containing protein 1 [Megalops cyprinoides]